MKRVIATFADEKMRSVQDLTLPRLLEYAAFCGCDLVNRLPAISLGRPIAWGKFYLLEDLLAQYEEVLWVDADCLVKPSCNVNLFEQVPADFIQALHFHRWPLEDKSISIVPNTGVWLVRREVLPWLWVAKRLTHLVSHGWWEQAAIAILLGFTLPVGNGPCTASSIPNALMLRTSSLGVEWNYHPKSVLKPSCGPYIIHALGQSTDKLAMLKSELEQCQK